MKCILKKMESVSIDWIQITESRVQWLDLVNTATSGELPDQLSGYRLLKDDFVRRIVLCYSIQRTKLALMMIYCRYTSIFAKPMTPYHMVQLGEYFYLYFIKNSPYQKMFQINVLDTEIRF
jgi:hypothetical protein